MKGIRENLDELQKENESNQSSEWLIKAYSLLRFDMAKAEAS